MIGDIAKNGGVLLAVHAVAYFLVTALPNAAVTALGLLGGDPALVRSFWQSRHPLPYLQHLMHFMIGDFGQTIDHVPVLDEIGAALQVSVPELALSLIIAAALLAIVLRFRGTRQEPSAMFDYLSFLPPFIVPFALAAALFSGALAGSNAALETATAASIALPVFFMLASLFLREQNEQTRKPYPSALRANGAAADAVDRAINQVVLLRLSSIFDRVLVTALLCLILAEPTLNQPGLGSLIARAVRTSDPNLTVAAVVVTAILAVVPGMITLWAGHLYGAWAGRSP